MSDTATNETITFKVHAALQLFPEMDDDRFQALAANIAERGLDQPGMRTPDGQILAGRARMKACDTQACKDAGREMRWEIYDGHDSAAWIFADNLRRDLSIPQRGAIAAELCRQRRGKMNPQICGFTVEQAARVMGVSKRTVESCIAIRRARPDLHEQLKRGEISVHAAEEQMRQPQRTGGDSDDDSGDSDDSGGDDSRDNSGSDSRDRDNPLEILRTNCRRLTHALGQDYAAEVPGPGYAADIWQAARLVGQLKLVARQTTRLAERKFEEIRRWIATEHPLQDVRTRVLVETRMLPDSPEPYAAELAAAELAAPEPAVEPAVADTVAQDTASGSDTITTLPNGTPGDDSATVNPTLASESVPMTGSDSIALTNALPGSDSPIINTPVGDDSTTVNDNGQPSYTAALSDGDSTPPAVIPIDKLLSTEEAAVAVSALRGTKVSKETLLAILAKNLIDPRPVLLPDAEITDTHDDGYRWSEANIRQAVVQHPKYQEAAEKNKKEKPKKFSIVEEALKKTGEIALGPTGRPAAD